MFTFKPINRQRGAALLVCLIFMLALTIIGTGAMQSSVLQEKMAGTTRDLNTALQSAEVAMREAETYLQKPAIGPFDGSVAGYYASCAYGATGSSCAPSWTTMNNHTAWKTSAAALTGSNTYQQPEYMIQELEPTPVAGSTIMVGGGAQPQMIRTFRIVARGYGASSLTTVVLQSMYRLE